MLFKQRWINVEITGEKSVCTCYILICRFMQKESQQHNDKGRGKTSLKNIPLTLLQGLCVRGSWRLNKDCNILTLPAPLDIAVCCSPDAQLEALGLSFLHHILSLTRLVPNSIGDPEGPFCWVVAFLTTSRLQLVWSPTLSGAPEGPLHRTVAFSTTSSPTSLVPNSLTSCLHRVI